MNLSNKFLIAILLMIFSIVFFFTYNNINEQKRIFDSEVTKRISLMKNNLKQNALFTITHYKEIIENDLASMNLSHINVLFEQLIKREEVLGVSLFNEENNIQMFAGQSFKKSVSKLSFEEKKEFYIISTPIILTKKWGTLSIVYSLKQLNIEMLNTKIEKDNAISKSIGKSIILSSFIALFFGLLGFYWSKKLIKPILLLTEISKKIANGKLDDYNNLMKITSKDEVGILAKTFTKMAYKLEKSYKDLKVLNESLERKVKQRTIQLEEAKYKAENSTKIKSEFLANMSHEIRTPMHGILGLSHLVLSTNLSSKQRNYIEKIDKSSKNLLRIINDILDFSKMEAGQLTLDKTQFSIFDLINNILDLVEVKIHEKNLELIVDYDLKLPNILYADSLRVSQILTNLLTNAIKFTKYGEIRININKIKNNRFQFEVIDTGIGLDKTEQDKLFKSFSQADSSTSRKYGGSGLGLSISKQLVELMNGEIKVNSQKGLGSTFTFEVDLEEISSNRSTKQTLEGKKVLILESNDRWKDILFKNLSYLELEIFKINEISNIADFLSKNKIDFILIDWKILEDKPLNILSSIKKKNKDLLIFTTSIYGHDFIQSRIKDYEIDGIIKKPFIIEYLFNELSQTISNKISQNNSSSNHSNSLKLEINTLSSSNILLVEDNLINQEIILGLLEDSGINIDLAQNGQEAVDLMFNNPKKYELILMDIQMPVMDGFEATRIIRIKNQKIPIIALTANAMVQDKEKTKESEITEHLDKPINVNKLYEILLKYISKKTSVLKKINIEDEKNAVFPTLKNIDIKKGLSFLGNNSTLYKNILNNFYKDYVNINFNALLDKDFYIILHTIKGLSANIGANNLSSIAKKIEDIKDRRLISSLNEELYKVLKDIESINTSESKNIKKKKFLEKEKRDTLFKSLLQACKTKLIKKCEPLIKELEEYELLEDDLILFEQVKKELKRYRFKEIINLLEDDGK